MAGIEKTEITQLNDHLWLLNDKEGAACYVTAGTEKALVIDTMNGYVDVREAAEELTGKPVTVINTHGHGDHILGNVYFDSAMITAEDLPMAEAFSKMPGFIEACEKYGLRMPPFETVKDGDLIDLGGLTAEVIALPGHTLGGICVLLREDRILFTGDGINRHLWMQLEDTLPLADALKCLDGIAWVQEKADYILHGHAHGFEDISLFGKMREGLRQLVEQNGTEVTDGDREYDWFGGKAIQHEFDANSVIVYTPAKLPKTDMKPEFAKIDSFCGCDCGTCGFKANGQCAGCAATKGRPFHVQEGKPCAIAECCISKGKRWCADCAKFPCGILKQFSSDPEHGDHPAGARIERLQSMKKDLLKKARRGQNEVAVCGFVCGESCFLGEWCGWCSSEYNCCSYATVQPDGICPNVSCAKEKGLANCGYCPELAACTKGFYGNTAEPGAVSLAKASAMFIGKYGATNFVSMVKYILKEKKVRYTDFFTDTSSPEKVFEDMENFYREP